MTTVAIQLKFFLIRRILLFFVILISNVTIADCLLVKSMKRVHYSSIGKPLLSSSSSRLHARSSVTPELQESINMLRNACETRSAVSADIAESINKIELLPTGVTCTDLIGSWELIYSSLIPGGFFPVCEICDFFGYSITSSWGPLPLGGFTGRSAVISQTNPARIDFASDIYKIGGIQINLKDVKQRSYTFLYADDYFAVARSSSGGGTLLKKCQTE